jgi:hypothetical protein
MSRSQIVLLIIVNIPLYVFIYRLIATTWEGYSNSIFNEEDDDSEDAERYYKISITALFSGVIVYAEYWIITRLLF